MTESTKLADLCSNARLGAELESDIRSRVNPQYAHTIGTESYERRLLLGEIDRLRAALEWITDNGPDDAWEMRAAAREALEVPNATGKPTAELGNEIERYLRQLAPHQNERQGPTLLRDALAEIARLRQGDTCARVCECTAYRTELRQLREAVRKVMPENWREDHDWVRLAEAHGLVPNATGEQPAANELNKG